MRILIVAGTLLATTAAFSSVASARCTIRNETSYSFTVESGNTSNQRVGSHTTTSIDDGRIRARSDDGQSAGGSCGDGETVRIVEDHGTVMIVHD